MYKVVQRIDYKGFQLQERHIDSGGVAVAPSLGGGRKLTPSGSMTSVQWAVMRMLADREEEVSLAWSESDAKRQVDEMVG